MHYILTQGVYTACTSWNFNEVYFHRSVAHAVKLVLMFICSRLETVLFNEHTVIILGVRV